MTELEELREFKKRYEGNQLNKAFDRLQSLIDAPYRNKCDTVMSINSFRVLADCLILLKEEVTKGK